MEHSDRSHNSKIKEQQKVKKRKEETQCRSCWNIRTRCYHNSYLLWLKLYQMVMGYVILCSWHLKIAFSHFRSNRMLCHFAMVGMCVSYFIIAYVHVSLLFFFFWLTNKIGYSVTCSFLLRLCIVFDFNGVSLKIGAFFLINFDFLFLNLFRIDFDNDGWIWLISFAQNPFYY